MSPNPEETIQSNRCGRVAAAARDGRLAKGTADTQVMKIAQHTPGPWSIERGIITSPTRPVAKIQPSGEIFHNVLAADAALIAAAPDLLNMLQRLYAEIMDSEAAKVGTSRVALCTLEHVRAAIAKAKG